MRDRQIGNIHFIRGENKGRYPFNNSVFIAGKKSHVIIDPASNRDKLIKLRDKEGVDEVWLTHWHEDHFSYLYLFDKCLLRISQTDFPPLTSIEQMLDAYGIEDGNFREYWKEAFQQQFHFQPQKSAKFINDGQIIDLGGTTAKAIATPGHTPGHLSFFFREEAVLLLGDYDLTSFGPWYGDAHSSIEDTINSLRILKKIPARVLLTCHDQGFFEANHDNVWQRYEDKIYERENKILGYLAKGAGTLDEIADAWLIYGKPREPLAFFQFGERALLKKHLERMQKLGLVAIDKETYIKI